MPSSAPDDPADRIRQILREQEPGLRDGSAATKRPLLIAAVLCVIVVAAGLWVASLNAPEPAPSPPPHPSTPTLLHIPPNAAIDWHAMGEGYRKANLLPEAIAAYDDAIRIDPLFVEAWRDRALVHHTMKDLIAARRDLEEALRLSPDPSPLREEIQHLQETLK